MLSVVAGLIFVGLQMMQTQRIALASQQQARAGILNDMVLGLTEADVDFQSIFWKRNFQNSLSTEILGDDRLPMLELWSPRAAESRRAIAQAAGESVSVRDRSLNGSEPQLLPEIFLWTPR